MTDDRRTRRTVLRTAGLTASSAVFAGCIDESSTEADPGTSTGNGGGDEGPRDAGSDGASAESDGGSGADGARTDSDTAADDDAANEPESDDGSSTDPVNTDERFEIEPGTEIVLRSDGITWVGTRPSAIENVENPSVVLSAGERYVIGWRENASRRIAHNIAIYDDTESVVDNLETDVTADPGDDQRLEFAASSEMAEYGCQPHYSA